MAHVIASKGQGHRETTSYLAAGTLAATWTSAGYALGPAADVVSFHTWHTVAATCFRHIHRFVARSSMSLRGRV